MHSRRADATASHTHRWAALLAAVLALVAALVPTTPAAAADIPGAITGVDITQESAAYGGSVDVRMTWAVPDDSQAGDTFWVQLPDSLAKIGGLTFDLHEDNDPAKPVVARAQVVDGRIVFTLTDYVDTHTNVRGDAFITAQLVQGETTAGETNEFTFVTEVGEYTDTVVVGPVGNNISRPVKYGYWTDPVLEDEGSRDGALTWRLRSSVGPLSRIVFTDERGPGHVLDCAGLDVRLLSDFDANGVWHSNVAMPASQHEIVRCDETGFQIVVTDLDEGEVAIVRYTSTVTEERDSYTNSATVVEDDVPSSTGTHVERVTAGGGGIGDNIPSIDIEKWSTVDGPDAGDHDAGPGKELDPVADEEITFTITNDGREDLVDVVVTDTTEAGPDLQDLVCSFPDGSTGTTWAGPFEIGDSFTCTATLPAMGPSAEHADVAGVTGTGAGSGRTVTDSDPWHGYTPEAPPTEEPSEPTEEPTEPTTEPAEPTEPTEPAEPIEEPTEPTVTPSVSSGGTVEAPALAHTGAGSAAWLAGASGLLLAAGVALLVARRRQAASQG